MCKIEAEKTDEYIEIKSVININPEFNQIINQYKLEIARTFENLENYSKIFDASLEFWRFMDRI